MYIEETNELAEFTIWADGGRCGLLLVPTGKDPIEAETDGDFTLALELARRVIRGSRWRGYPSELIELMTATLERAEAVA